MLGAIIGGVSALGQSVMGAIQNGKANRMMNNLKRPVQTVQQEYYDNVADAQSQSRIGMQSQQYNNALQNTQRNLNAGLRMLGRSRSPVGLASLVRAQNDATLQLDAQDANMRSANQRMLMQQRGILGAQHKDAFNWNQKENYLGQLARAQALKGAGMQNMAGGLQSAGMLGMTALQGESMSSGGSQGQYPDMAGKSILGQSITDKLFKKRYDQLPMAGSIGVRSTTGGLG